MVLVKFELKPREELWMQREYLRQDERSAKHQKLFISDTVCGTL
jgi:hypothetical protein